MKKILLLDIENVHKTENELLDLLKNYSYVYLVYAKSPISLTLDGIQELASFVVSKRLVLIKMPKSGPDSADFGLAFLAGQLSIQMDKSSTEFDVMSNDKKFIYVVDLLKIMGFNATQIKKEVVPLKEKLEISNLKNKNNKDLFLVVELLLKNQPKQFNSLNNALKSWTKGKNIDVKKTIELLKSLKLINIINQSVTYDLLKMIEVEELNSQSNIDTLIEKLPEAEEILSKPHLLNTKKYCEYLSKIKNNKPNVESSLLNSIKAVLRLDNEQTSLNQFHLLNKFKLINVISSKVSYNEELIEAWNRIDLTTLKAVNTELVTTLVENESSLLV